MSLCKLPPPGWYCTRDAGHGGPCAAYPRPHRGGMDLGGVIFWIVVFSIFTGVTVYKAMSGQWTN